MLKIAICDDDFEEMESERTLLEEAMPEGEEYCIDSYLSAEKLLLSDKLYNILVLDVEMQGLNGIETASAVHKFNPDCLIFFATHHVDYMDEALNKHAFRFWTKPLKHSRLVYGIESAIKELDRHKKRVIVSCQRNNVSIPLDDVICVYHKDRQTVIVAIDGEFATTNSFQRVVKQLDKNCFGLTHGSYYVNFNYVVKYNKSEVELKCGNKMYTVFMARRRYFDFDKSFKEWSCVFY